VSILEDSKKYYYLWMPQIPSKMNPHCVPKFPYERAEIGIMGSAKIWKFGARHRGTSL
jgi:hypothetical protein